MWFGNAVLTNRGFIDRLAFSHKIFIAPWIDGLAQQISFHFLLLVIIKVNG